MNRQCHFRTGIPFPSPLNSWKGRGYGVRGKFMPTPAIPALPINPKRNNKLPELIPNMFQNNNLKFPVNRGREKHG